MAKKISFLIVVVMLMALLTPAHSFAQRSIKIEINGETLSFDVNPFLQNGRTMVPLRGVFEKLGSEVQWDEKERSVWIENEEIKIQLIVEKETVYIYRKNIEMDVPEEIQLDVAPMIVNQRTFVPIRFVVETLGAEVDWDDSTSTVKVAVQDVLPVARLLSFEVIDAGELQEKQEMMKWYEENYKTKGTYYFVEGQTTYVLVSTGERPTGGYHVEIYEATMIAPGRVHISSQVISPEPDMMVTQAITYPHALVRIENESIDEIRGNIGEYTKDLRRKDLPYEVIEDAEIKDDAEFIQWYETSKQTRGIHFKRIDKDVFVLVAAGQKPTGGYSVSLLNVTLKNDDEVYIYAHLNSPKPEDMVSTVITYPHVLIRIDSETIKNVEGEIKDEIPQPIRDIGANIPVEEVKSIQLFNLQQEKIKEYQSEEIEGIINSFNNSKIDDSPYILVLTGNTMLITLHDGSEIRLTSYGSKTNIVAYGEREGKYYGFHLICPEIAEILLSME